MIHSWVSTVGKRLIEILRAEGPGAPWLLLCVALGILMVVWIGYVIDKQAMTSVDIYIP
jgi:hypothetical protein